MLRVSTGLRNAMLITDSLKANLDGGFIKLYAGAVPTDADADLGAATVLCTITKNGDGVTGLTMAAAAVAGSLSKFAETWSGTNATSGTASFWRFYKTGDTGTASTTDLRLQGLAATSGSELVLTNVVLTGGATTSIDYCAFALPG